MGVTATTFSVQYIKKQHHVCKIKTLEVYSWCLLDKFWKQQRQPGFVIQINSIQNKTLKILKGILQKNEPPVTSKAQTGRESWNYPGEKI